jgi:hypothetical protein
MNDLKPWLMPIETVEALEIMTEVAKTIRNVAEFASLRNQLRVQLRNAALRLEDFVKVTGRGIVDESLILAIDDMARDKKRKGGSIAEIMEALEDHISTHNRRAK